MSSKIKLLVISFFLVCSANAQKIEYPIVSVLDGDSVIIFTTEQGRKLVKINELKNECLENESVLKQENGKQKTIITSQKTQLDNLNTVVADKDTIIENTNNLKKICEDENAQLKKDVRKQKIAKWLSVGGIVVVGILGIVF